MAATARCEITGLDRVVGVPSSKMPYAIHGWLIEHKD